MDIQVKNRRRARVAKSRGIPAVIKSVTLETFLLHDSKALHKYMDGVRQNNNYLWFLEIQINFDRLCSVVWVGIETSTLGSKITSCY